jgi:elongation factor 3
VQFKAKLFIMPATVAYTPVADLLPVMKEAGKKTPPAPRIEALEKIKELIEADDFKKYEAFAVQEALPVILKRMDDKPKVVEAANAAGAALVEKVSVQAFPVVSEQLYTEMTEESKWKSKFGAIKLLNQLLDRVANLDQDLVCACLPSLVPVLSGMVHDTKAEISDSAKLCLTKAMKGITNRDLEPMVEDLVEAIVNRDLTIQTIQKLGGVVFVQTVEGSALAVVVPLIQAGFRQPKSVTRRLCARIIGNMAKLVEDPVDAAPFLLELIPALTEVKETIPDPEARQVAEQTLAALERILSEANAQAIAKATRDPKVMAGKISEQVKDADETLVNYLAVIATSLIKSKTTEESEFESELTPYLELVGASNEWKFICDEAQKVIGGSIVQEQEEDDGTELCDCEFTLAYGTKILLHNASMKLKKGKKYGLLGQNDCGKTTLMRAIADSSLDGFPDASEVRTVFVEADIQGELSHLDCVNYVLAFPPIAAMGATEEQVRSVLIRVGFTEGKAAGAGGDCDDPISSLSGGWRMKLALARAMLQKADILLMDEPTNHLDVKNVKWVESYINSLKETTVIMVSHDSGLLDNCCDYILRMDRLKLHTHKGNLSALRQTHPDEVASFFEFKASKFTFKFPQPSFLEGVKSRGKALLKMDKVTFTYPGNNVPTIKDITVRASMASRVACVGVNGAGKSTMIKVLTGELEPQQGVVWKFPNSRIGYIAQHAFHHIESHLDKTPNEYIRWRFEYGDDKEGLDKASMKLSEDDEKEIAKPVEYTWKDEKGQIKKQKRTIQRTTGNRRPKQDKKKVFEYEVAWVGMGMDSNTWYTEEQLSKFNKVFEKVIRMIDAKIAIRESVAARPLTQQNVERHLADVGLESEYATHSRLSTLSGGQKVKVVLAAAMWDQPHILILDEPTNYLDRDSLGALADAINVYEGGIIMITHNDAFCRQLCPERWVLEAGSLNTEGDVEWMAKAAEQAVEFEKVEEMVDASGNEVKLKSAKKLTAKEKKKLMKLIKDKIASGEELDEDEESYAIEWNL